MHARRPRLIARHRGPIALVLLVAILPLVGYLIATAGHSPKTVKLSAADASPGASALAGATPAPASPLARVCGNSRLLSGPSAAPAGAVKIPAGNNSRYAQNFNLRPDTTYWLASGKHTLGKSEFAQIQPKNGDTFIGAPGAILSGQGSNDSAFSGPALNVTIKYLTIERFTPPGSQGAVNHDQSQGWVISHDTIQDNAPGAGMMIASDNAVTHDCLTRNGQYAFNASGASHGQGASSLTGGPTNITLNHNEISFNNTCNFEDVSPNPVPRSQRSPHCRGGGESDACGCSGGGKFWEVQNAAVRGNYVHGNYDVGLWADTNNDGFIFKGNYIADNYGSGILYEISYNALIVDNVFVRNANGEGPTNGGFPSGAIYISESGGDRRVHNAAGIKTLTISHNVFTNNWSGVVLWESADRFCGSPNNSSTGTCTLVDRSVANVRTCDRNHLQRATRARQPDYYDLCRWRTQNVLVRDNRFNMNFAAVPRCHGAANSCGENGIFSQDGTSPGWSPYKGFVISRAITRTRHNLFSNNTYAGQWRFMYHDQARVLTLAGWRAKQQN